jgi:hypothetical protein
MDQRKKSLNNSEMTPQFTAHVTTSPCEIAHKHQPILIKYTQDRENGTRPLTNSQHRTPHGSHQMNHIAATDMRALSDLALFYPGMADSRLAGDTLFFTAADGKVHPLIDLCSDSSEDEVAAGGTCDTFVLVGNDAREEAEFSKEPAVPG